MVVFDCYIKLDKNTFIIFWNSLVLQCQFSCHGLYKQTQLIVTKYDSIKINKTEYKIKPKQTADVPGMYFFLDVEISFYWIRVKYTINYLTNWLLIWMKANLCFYFISTWNAHEED